LKIAGQVTAKIELGRPNDEVVGFDGHIAQLVNPINANLRPAGNEGGLFAWIVRVLDRFNLRAAAAAREKAHPPTVGGIREVGGRRGDFLRAELRLLNRGRRSGVGGRLPGPHPACEDFRLCI
jgi:hypothetical protein